MKRVFLSSWYGAPDRDLVSDVETLVASHGLSVATGRVLGGGGLTDGVKKLIDGADALVALVTHRHDPTATHPWVIDELGYALARDQRAIALVEAGVPYHGMWASREHIPYDPAAPLPAFLRLSRTLGEWKREAGRTIKVPLGPPALARALWTAKSATCKYRKVTDGAPGAWVEATPIPEPGGTSLLVAGVRENDLVQLHVKVGKAVWQSLAVSQWLPIELARTSGGKS